jgi:hypothetical protein
MRDCPKCFKPVDGASCPHCGFSEPGSSGKPIVPQRVILCANCSELGILTENTRGGDGKEPHPGPWYCHRHFPPFSGRAYATKPAPPPQGFQSLKALVSRVPKDPEDHAERAAIQGEGA